MAGGSFGGGTGAELDPYLIEDAADLDAVRNNLSAHYKQIADIDLESWGNWEPIGNYYTTIEGDLYEEHEFNGIYNGNGYKIKKLKAMRTGSNSYITKDGRDWIWDHSGLFGVVEGQIRNLIVIDSECGATGNGSCGGIVGSLGGLVENCSFDGAIKYGYWTGGLVGVSFGVVLNSFTSGSLASGSVAGGGFVGRASRNSIFKNCYSMMEITGASINYSDKCATGGFGGEVSSVSTNWPYVENCYFAGTFEELSWFLPENPSAFWGKTYDNVVNVGGSPTYPSRLITANCYYDNEIIEYSDDHAEGKSTVEMKDINTFLPNWNIAEESLVTQDSNGWNSNYTWGIGSANDGYPFLWIDGLPPEAINIWVNKANQFHRTEGLPPKIGGQFMKYVSCWIKKGDRFHPV